jgi:ketosteroid isomerase-like protein
MLLSLSLVFLSSCQPCRESTDGERVQIESQVFAAHRQVIAAAEALNADAMFSHILDNEGVILQNGLFHHGRQSALNDTKTGFNGIDTLKYQFDEEVIEVLAWDKALLKAAGTSTVRLTDGREFTTPFAETVIFTKTPDGWKILHAHQSVPVR